MNNDLNEKNFFLFCAKHYDNPSAISDEEFYEDIGRIKYIKKLLTRYKVTGELKERLILNHLIVLANVFGQEALSRIIWLKMYDQLREIKPFLITLNLMPKKPVSVAGKSHDPDDVELDVKIVEILRGIPR